VRSTQAVLALRPANTSLLPSIGLGAGQSSDQHAVTAKDDRESAQQRIARSLLTVNARSERSPAQRQRDVRQLGLRRENVRLLEGDTRHATFEGFFFEEQRAVATRPHVFCSPPC